MHIPVIVMLVISVLSLIALFAIDLGISKGEDNHEKKDKSGNHPHEQ